MKKNKQKKGMLKATDPSINTLADFVATLENMNTTVSNWKSYDDATLASLTNNVESMASYIQTPDYQNQNSTIQTGVKNTIIGLSLSVSLNYWSEAFTIYRMALISLLNNSIQFFQNPTTNQNKAA